MHRLGDRFARNNVVWGMAASGPYSYPYPYPYPYLGLGIRY